MYALIPETSLLSAIPQISLFKYITGIEENSEYIFFFKDNWIDSIEIQVADTNTFSIDVLCKKLDENNLNIYVENKNVFIYPGRKLVTEIPDYKTNNFHEKISYQENNGLTDTERNYIQGKKIASVEVLSVGNKNNSKNDQKCMVSGNIRDEATGEALIGATIYVEELEIGIATNVDGEFKLVLKPGKYKILVNYISMRQKEYYLQVYSSGRLNIEMKKELIEIDEVVITSGHFHHVKGMQMGFEKISTKTMKEIPMVMGEKDIIKVAQMLPGVESVGEGSSGFNVRGSSADQNMFYINKIPVYNTSHLFGFFTSFSPDIVNDFTLYKGHIPVKFGGRLASVFDISTRQGNKKKFFGQGGISPVTSHFSFEGPLQKNKTSVVTSLRSSYSDWLLNRIGSFNNIKNSNAFFYDATLGINTEIGENNLFKVFGYRSFDRFNISGYNKYEYSNTGSSVTWKHQFPKSLTSDISYVYSNYMFNNIELKNPSDAHSNKYSIEQHEIKGDFNFTSLNNHSLCFGASGILFKLNRGDLLPYGDESHWIPVSLGTENGMEGGLYISDEFRLLPRLSLSAGLRFSFFMSLGPGKVNVYYEGSPKNEYSIKDTIMFDKGQVSRFYFNPDMRVALNYRLGDNSSVKASYNKLSQYIFMLSNTIAISPNDQWKLVDYNIRPPVSHQVSAGIYNDFFNNSIQTSLEIYHKWINNIIEYKDGADFISPDPVEMQILQGIQNTKGIEFMLKKKSGNLTGWLSYAYSRSFISVNGPAYEEKINNGKSYPSNYDKPHSINLVLNNRLSRRFSYSCNFVYTTGRPITYPISKYYSEGQEFLYYSKRNKYRIPDYIRLDFSVNIEGNLKKKKLMHSYWMINIYNLLGRKNAYSVFYEVEDNALQGYRLSIFARPIITISWNFKFGNYLSE